mgnify:FL=1
MMVNWSTPWGNFVEQWGIWELLWSGEESWQRPRDRADLGYRGAPTLRPGVLHGGMLPCHKDLRFPSHHHSDRIAKTPVQLALGG